VRRRTSWQQTGFRDEEWVVSGIAEQGNMIAPSLAVLYESVAGELEEVELVLRREMRSRHPYVDELVRYGCLLAGKRLRPALLLLAAKACGEVRSDHVLLAAVLEMVHTATLVHDDVLDAASVRRHRATVNARWDSEASVLLGDFLFSHAFYLASTLDSTLACQLIGRATNIVCEGEIRQKGSCADWTLDEATYLEILDSKTAELCACCCHLGAHLAGATPTLTQHLTQYGSHLGIAFQITDDLLDVVGTESTAGKSLGTDLQKLKPTLPLIYALRAANAAQRAEIMELVRGDSVDGGERLRALFEKIGAIAYTREKAEQYAECAVDELAPLPDNVATAALRSMAAFVAQRAF
jgi:octaprenyl-diphosphate synthase